MMRMLMDSVDAILREELARVKRQRGDSFNSLHEAYGVMREEIMETAENGVQMANREKLFWQATRNDDQQGAIAAATGVRRYALMLACEAIQVAAVATKAIITAKHMKGGCKR